MRLVRYAPAGPPAGAPRFALVEGDGDAAEAIECSDPFAAGDGTRPTPLPGAAPVPLSSLCLLAPAAPTKVICASGTYRAVILSMKKEWPTEPVLFLKPSTAVTGPGTDIVWPAQGVEELTHEPELAVVISRRAKDVTVEEAASCILGYTCANDVSAWDVLQRVTHFTRPKAHDTFCPLGPWIVSAGDGFDPDDAGIRSYVDGVIALDTRTSDMVFRVAEIVSFCSRIMTLLPGDVISTGACGVGQVQPGQRVEIEIDGIGRLANTVARA